MCAAPFKLMEKETSCGAVESVANELACRADVLAMLTPWFALMSLMQPGATDRYVLVVEHYGGQTANLPDPVEVCYAQLEARCKTGPAAGRRRLCGSRDCDRACGRACVLHSEVGRIKGAAVYNLREGQGKLARVEGEAKARQHRCSAVEGAASALDLQCTLLHNCNHRGV